MAQGDARTILVTGATDGVGRMVARRLGGAGAHVLVHGRDRARGEAVVREIAAGGKGSATFHAADLASLAEVRALAETVLAQNPRIDVLVNNAGIGSGGVAGTRAQSADGHELRFAVNYLAGFLLTLLLLPRLVASAPSRIVNVASLGQRALDFDDVMLTRGYSGGRAYSQSKLAQIGFTAELAERLAGTGVTATSLHPATYMDTTMVHQAGVVPTSTVEQGADAIQALIDGADTAAMQGRFFDGKRPARPDLQAADPAARARLWALSLKLCGLPADFDPLRGNA